ncbi:hypothetical protein Tco_0262419, partial [Tanacetum coccineum]
MDFSKESVKKSWGKELANESGSEFIPRFDSSFVEFIQPCFCFSNSEEFMNVFMRIGFGSTIKLVSLDESRVVTFNGKFVSGFRNSDCGTGIQSDNTVSNPHGFIIHWIVILKNIKKVTEVIDVENWRIDNSRVLRWIVSLIERNSFVSSTKSSIQRAAFEDFGQSTGKVRDKVFTVNLHHDGVFICNPVRYVYGELKQITDIDFEDYDVLEFLTIEGNVNDTPFESSDEYESSDEVEEIDYVDFHTEGMRYEHPEQLKLALANYGVANGYQLWVNMMLLETGCQIQSTGNAPDIYMPTSKISSVINTEAYDYLIGRDPNSWSRAFFNLTVKCLAFKNRICESYHRAILLQIRKPIITMLEDIRVYLMQRIVAMHNIVVNLEDHITPTVRKKLAYLKRKQ